MNSCFFPSLCLLLQTVMVIVVFREVMEVPCVSVRPELIRQTQTNLHEVTRHPFFQPVFRLVNGKRPPVFRQVKGNYGPP